MIAQHGESQSKRCLVSIVFHSTFCHLIILGKFIRSDLEKKEIHAFQRIGEKKKFLKKTKTFRW
jgi:hypothetical protein